jgi:hypothetical protein
MARRERAPQEAANAAVLGAAMGVVLRGIALLQKMHSTLTPDEAELLRVNDAMVRARQPFFYPACSWEDVLDVI